MITGSKYLVVLMLIGGLVLDVGMLILSDSILYYGVEHLIPILDSNGSICRYRAREVHRPFQSFSCLERLLGRAQWKSSISKLGVPENWLID